MPNILESVYGAIWFAISIHDCTCIIETNIMKSK